MILKKVKEELYRINLKSLWNRDFYSKREIGITPINSEYYKEMSFRLLYEGIYHDSDGFILEINVGIASNEFGYYEFYVEDYMGGSICENYENFGDAIKRFVKFTNIRKPKIFIDNENGDAVCVDFRIGPYAIIRSE